MNDIISKVREIGKQVKPRTLTSVCLKTAEEVGELSTEILIKEGLSYKKAGSDGVVGEAIDAILCLVDIIIIASPKIKNETFNKIISNRIHRETSLLDCGMVIVKGLGELTNEITNKYTESESLVPLVSIILISQLYNVIEIDSPNITDDEINDIADKKMAKWLEKQKK